MDLRTHRIKSAADVFLLGSEIYSQEAGKVGRKFTIPLFVWQSPAPTLLGYMDQHIHICAGQRIKIVPAIATSE
jgi:hypothetical protein